MKLQNAIAITLTLLCFATLPLPANAEPKPNCRAPQTQSEINMCAARKERAADRQLNQVYRTLLAKFEGTPKEHQLIEVERNWLKWRDAKCPLQSQYKGGTMAPAAHLLCITSLTEQRTRVLQASERGYLGGELSLGSHS